MQVSGQCGFNLDDKMAQDAFEQRVGRCHFQDIMDFAMSKYICLDDDAFEHFIIVNEHMEIQQVFSHQEDDYVIIYSDSAGLGTHRQRFYLRTIDSDEFKTVNMWVFEGQSQRLEDDELQSLGVSEETILNQLQLWLEQHHIEHATLNFNRLILVMIKSI
jgi:hypothetical protein